MAHVFISYSHTDRVYARKLADHLLANGFDVWIDDRINFGANWEYVIFEALEACAAYIIIMTPTSYKRPWVQSERLYAQKLGKPTFPLLLEGQVFPMYGGIQSYDVSGEKLPPDKFLEDLANFVARSETRGRDVAEEPQRQAFHEGGHAPLDEVRESSPRVPQQAERHSRLPRRMLLLAGAGIVTLAAVIILAVSALNNGGSGNASAPTSTLTQGVEPATNQVVDAPTLTPTPTETRTPTSLPTATPTRIVNPTSTRIISPSLIPSLTPSSSPTPLPPTSLPTITPSPPVISDGDMMTYAAKNCDYGGEFQSIEALDAQTVRFTLCYPDAAFPAKVALGSFAIHPSEYLEATVAGRELLENPIGTGPWKLDYWDIGSEIVFARNDDYWGEPAREPTLVFRWNLESAARLVELQNGNVDGIDIPSPLDFDVIANDPNLQLLARAGLNVLYLGINNTVEPFDNVRVRQALAYAIDRQRIVDNFFPPGSSVADQFMPVSVLGYTPEVEPFPYDPAMARQLLEEAAAEDGFTLPIETTLSYRNVQRSYMGQPSAVATDLQAQLAQVGINLIIDEQASVVFLDNAFTGKLSLFLFGSGILIPDATDLLDVHFGIGANAQFGNKFPEITEPLALSAQFADPEVRYRHYIDANTAIRDLVPMVPIAHAGSEVAYRATIQGAYASPLWNDNFSVMEDSSDDILIWMQSNEPLSLYCADETDSDSLRACAQTNESLLAYEIGGTAVVPSLAVSYDVSSDGLAWTFHLRDGVTFHDGSALDANDVVMSYVVEWDASHPLHLGRTGNFEHFRELFDNFLNLTSTG